MKMSLLLFDRRGNDFLETGAAFFHSFHAGAAQCPHPILCSLLADCILINLFACIQDNVLDRLTEVKRFMNCSTSFVASITFVATDCFVHFMSVEFLFGKTKL